MEEKKWELYNLQFVIVFDKLVNDISQKLKSNGKITILSIPDDAPEDIPRISIRDENGFKIEISKSRINIFFSNLQEILKNSDNIKKELKQKIYQIINSLTFDIAWIGLILRSINENSEANKNMQKIISPYGQKIIQLNDNSNDFSIKYHKKTQTEINSIKYKGDFSITLGSNVRNKNTNKQVGNIIILDINTQQLSNVKYNKEIISLFIDKVFSEQNKIFAKLV